MGLIIFWSTSRTFSGPEGGDLLSEAGNNLELDIIKDDLSSFSGVLSSQTIESGAFVSDFFNRDPITYTCSCLHTQTPPLSKDLDYSLQSVSVRGTEVLVGKSNTDTTETRVQNALNILQELFETGTEVYLSGLPILNKTWIMTSIEFSRNPNTAGALTANITFEEVRKAGIEETEAPTIERARRRREGGRARARSNTTNNDRVTSFVEDFQELELEDIEAREQESQTSLPFERESNSALGYSHSWD